MTEIVVLSGKGGTGKTTITSSFAALAQGSAVIADCDVDAADLYLVLQPEVGQRFEFIAGKKATINADICSNANPGSNAEVGSGCSLCEQVCHFNAITGFKVDSLLCEGCSVCYHLCPQKAITMQQHQEGYYYQSTSAYGTVIHAKLDIAEENSGKLVAKVKDLAQQVAVDEQKDCIIVDGPPGTGCPVIASLANTDYALVITEPTVAGLHDLERVVQLAAHFKVPVAVCINKYDIDTTISQKIMDYCQDMSLQILGNIPFDKAVVDSIVAEQPVVEFAPHSPAAVAITAIWEEMRRAYYLV